MKIALYVHCFFPDHFYGTETYTLELANNLIAMGHEPVVVSAVFQGEEPRKSAVHVYNYLNIPIYCLDKNFYPHHNVRETYYQENLLDVHKKLLSEIKPDVVHVTHIINHTASLLEVTRDLEIPAIATFTDFFGFCFNNRLETSDGALCHGPSADRTNCLMCYLKARADGGHSGVTAGLIGLSPSLLPVIARSLRFFSRLPGMQRGSVTRFVDDIAERPSVLLQCYTAYRTAIAPTKFLRKAYLANGLTTPLQVMHFGVDVPRTPKSVHDVSSPVIFGFIGQIARHKGTDLLVDAFVRLSSGCAELHIYGSEDQDPEYVSALKDKGKGSSVFFKGTFPKEQLAGVLSKFDFLVIPSRWYENSPLVLLNSLATHTPVIVADVEGMTEFVDNGINGFVFRRASVDDLEGVLQKIIKDPGLISKMSKSTEYTRTTREMTEDVVRIYESVIRADARRRI